PCAGPGAITGPCPSSLWGSRQPAAWMIPSGSVEPPAKAAPPAAPAPPVEVVDVAEVVAVDGMSDAVTSTVPPCDSRNAITDHTCAGESCLVITGMIG